MATRKKNALASAVQTLAQGGVKPADTTLNAINIWDPKHAEATIVVGKLGLANDPEVIASAVGAIRADEAAKMSFTVFGDMVYAKGVRAADLRGEKENPEIIREVKDLIGALRFSTWCIGETPMIKLLRIWWDKNAAPKGSPIPMAWAVLTTDTRRSMREANGVVDSQFTRLVNALAQHDEKKKGVKKPTPTIEEQYLTILGPVLLFLQGIDQTRIDPKFDWKTEYDAVSAAVSRAKQARDLAHAARRA